MVEFRRASEGRGRAVPVPGGINYRSIVLHKAIVGGMTGDREDRASYPGCVLINAPKFKVHSIARESRPYSRFPPLGQRQVARL